MSQKEHLPSYLPDDYELIKETQEDGTVLFKHPTGSEVKTTNDHFYDYVHCWISQLQNLVNMLDDEAFGEFGTLCDILLDNAERDFDEAFSFIDRSIGHIRIETVTRGRYPYRAGRVVALSVEQVEEGGELMEHLAFYSHKDGEKPDVLDYMEELEIFVKEPMKLVHEILMVMWERGEMGDSPLLNSAKTTLWSCMLKWDQMDHYFKKEFRGDHPADDYRTETKNAMESRMCSDIGFKISELSDELKESLRTKFFGREEFQWLKRIIDAYGKKEEREKTEIENSEEIQEYREALMAA